MHTLYMFVVNGFSGFRRLKSDEPFRTNTPCVRITRSRIGPHRSSKRNVPHTRNRRRLLAYSPLLASATRDRGREWGLRAGHSATTITSMRFGRTQTPPPFLNRRSQMRMLGMVLALAIVIVGMRLASKPSSWYWIAGPPAKRPAVDGIERPSNKDIDFKVRVENSGSLRDDAFISKANPQTEGDTALPRVAERVDSRSGNGYNVEIDPAEFANIEDNTIGIRHKEKDAYEYVLAKARDIPLSYLEQAARNDIAFASLMTDSALYRGKLVTIDAEVQILTSYKASENSYGIETIYEAWLLNPDSGTNPYRFICTSLPKGIPQGAEIETSDDPVRVRATGYFFKRFGYASRHGLHTAPLLIGKRLKWFPRRTQPTEDLGLAPYVLLFVGVIAVSLSVVLWRFRISDRRFEKNHLKRLTTAPNDAIAALDGMETTDINEMFRQLSEDSQNQTEDLQDELDGNP